MMRIGGVAVAIVLVAAACSSGSQDEQAASDGSSIPPASTTASTTTAPPTTPEPAITIAPTTTSVPPTTTTEAAGPGDLVVTSALIGEGQPVATTITCEGEDVSPPFDISGIPTGTVSMVVIMEDPDAPVGVWDHWIAFDVDPTDSIPQDATDLGVAGSNSWGDARYGGPCPPPGSGPHRYISTVYALSTTLGLGAGSTKDAVLDALDGNVLAQGTLTGTYER